MGRVDFRFIAFTPALEGDKQFSLVKTIHSFLVLCRNMLPDTISAFGLKWIEMIFEYMQFCVYSLIVSVPFLSWYVAILSDCYDVCLLFD